MSDDRAAERLWPDVLQRQLEDALRALAEQMVEVIGQGGDAAAILVAEHALRDVLLHVLARAWSPTAACSDQVH